MLTKLGSTFYVMRVRISSLKREGGGGELFKRDF